MHIKKVILFVTCFLNIWFSKAQSVTIKWLVPEENSINQLVDTDAPMLDARIEINTKTRLNPAQIKIYRNHVLYSYNEEKLGTQPLAYSTRDRAEIALKLNLQEGTNEFYVEVTEPSQKFISKTLRINYYPSLASPLVNQTSNDCMAPLLKPCCMNLMPEKLSELAPY